MYMEAYGGVGSYADSIIKRSFEAAFARDAIQEQSNGAGSISSNAPKETPGVSNGVDRTTSLIMDRYDKGILAQDRLMSQIKAKNDLIQRMKSDIAKRDAVIGDALKTMKQINERGIK